MKRKDVDYSYTCSCNDAAGANVDREAALHADSTRGAAFFYTFQLKP